MTFLFGTTCILAILFMIVFIFIGIWLFIVALKAFRQLRYKNYILEKIYEKLSLIAENKYDKSDLIDEEYMDLVNLDKDDTVDIDLMDNISSFDKLDSKKSSKVN